MLDARSLRGQRYANLDPNAPTINHAHEALRHRENLTYCYRPVVRSDTRFVSSSRASFNSPKPVTASANATNYGLPGPFSAS